MRKILYKITAAAAAGLLLLNAAGCGSNPAGKNQGSSSSSSKPAVSASGATVSQSSIALPYAKSRSMNPFVTDAMINEALWPLLYDCISEPGENFKPVNRLASSIDNRGTTVTVHLKSGVAFSDGSPLTSSDVSYSFALVLSNPASNFYAQVSNIAAVSPQGSYTVVFTLKKPNPYIANVLDVPVIKNGSDKAGAIIGSGRYIFKQNGNSAVLNQNSRWHLGDSPKIKTISLADMPDNDSMFHSLEIGTINYMISDYGSGPQSNINASTKTINLNQMVYLGVNSAHSALADAHVRKAVSLALDRQTLCKESFSSRAKPSNLPFNPDFADAPKPDSKELSSDLSLARNELQLAGFTTENTSGVLYKTVNGAAQTLSFNLIVNKENAAKINAAQKIAYSLGKIGISVKVNQLDYNAFMAQVNSGSYDFYVGEIKLTDDMNLLPFFTAGGAASSGITQTGAGAASYSGFLGGTTSLTGFIGSFKNDMPFIPLCYKQGLVSYSRNFPKNIIATDQDIFYNIEQWQF